MPTAKPDLITFPKPRINLDVVDVFNTDPIDSLKEISVNPIWIQSQSWRQK